jgi:heterodisulfide reductase subunit A-like polyferredoxin
MAPKLVECGRHLNIDILTDTEVVRVDGEAGDFTVTLRRKPRYIDVTKCVGCGDCETVCPVTLPSQYDEGLAPRKAAYRLYPQAIPNAYAIEKRGVAPCRDGCPINQRAQGYIALIRERRYEDALRVIKEDNPFPSVCGRTCHHPCEGRCARALVDGAVSIMALKRFVADWVYERSTGPRVNESTSAQVSGSEVPAKKVAIVGAGPAGLTAAQDLVKKGYGVTVFEALPVAGGMMRVGIPEHRLPKAMLQREVDDILALGVELRTNSPIRDPQRLLADGYDAVYVATGRGSKDHRLGIEGEDLDGVMPAASFLRRVNLGEDVQVGRRVAVVGGGITAVDAATTARRLGATEVHLVYHRAKDQLPVYPHEMAAAEEEGVRLVEGATAVRVVGRDGKVIGLECARTDRGEIVDERGRRRPKVKPGTEFTLEVDTVITVAGQFSDLSFVDDEYQDLAGDPDTLATEHPGVFASARAKRPSFVVVAIAEGHKAAASIDRYLRGQPLEKPRKSAVPVVKWTRQELTQQVLTGEIQLHPRTELARRPVEERVAGFDEVFLPLTEEQAVAEAQRCLECGICSECLECVYACQADAIDHDMVEREEKVRVGAVILAPGYEVYNAQLSEEFGFGRYPNVVTALQFERLLSASGPTAGHVKRPSDGAIPKRIAFLQCIGSRDQTHDYCSAVCCMYATKEAIMAKEHEPDTEVHVFMMDMRAFSKGYEEYYHRARDRYGIKYTRCRVSSLCEDPKTKDLILRYITEDGQLVEEPFDMVVLSVGMEMSEKVRQLGRELGVQLDEYGFCHTVDFAPLETSRPGIFAVGPFVEPKDIPETVVDASGAAAEAAALLARVRGALARKAEYPPERDVSGEEPRVGVFVCHCGSNIAGFLDVKAVADYARTLPGVVHAETNLYSCSQDTITHITETIKEKGLNRVVVAACTPRTHEPLFQDSLRGAGLNPYLFEMANIRNQCSWVHSNDWEGATRKAKELVRMSVARVIRQQPLRTLDLSLEKSALIIGGGVAGLTAARSLAEQGFSAHLVEREAELGGNLRKVHFTLDQSDPQGFLAELIHAVESDPRITVHKETELVETKGFVGNFTSLLRRKDGQTLTVQHGVTIVATGGQEWRGDEYLLGQDARVMTQGDFEAWLAAQEAGEPGVGKPFPIVARSVVMIQCVGPAAQYCGRTCCTTALKNAIRLKQISPQTQVTVLYKDIRTYGFKERLYTDARRAGVLFIRYDDEHKPVVWADGDGKGGSELKVKVWEPMLRQELSLTPDLLILSTPMVPAEGSRELATVLKVPVDLDGWFLEAHPKLRPVDFASEGVFMAGAAHYPKLMRESIAQAQAAAARAATILSKPALRAGGVVAMVDQSKCTACLTCVRVCPYGVPVISAEKVGVGGIVGAADINPAACQGCGTCAGECPAKAIQLLHYTDAQVISKVDALFELPSAFVLESAMQGPRRGNRALQTER